MGKEALQALKCLRDHYQLTVDIDWITIDAYRTILHASGTDDEQRDSIAVTDQEPQLASENVQHFFESLRYLDVPADRLSLFFKHMHEIAARMEVTFNKIKDLEKSIKDLEENTY